MEGGIQGEFFSSSSSFFSVSCPSNPCSSSSRSPQREGRTARPRRSGRRSPPRPRSCADSPRPSASGGTRCWPRGGPRRSRAGGSPRSSTPGRGCWTAGAQDTSAGWAVPRGRRPGRRGGWRRWCPVLRAGRLLGAAHGCGCAGAVRRSGGAGVAHRLGAKGPPGAARGSRPAEARGPPRRGRVVRAGGGVKSFEQRAAELRRRPPVTDREHALADLDAGSRQERERVARRISAA